MSPDYEAWRTALWKIMDVAGQAMYDCLTIIRDTRGLEKPAFGARRGHRMERLWGEFVDRKVSEWTERDLKQTMALLAHHLLAFRPMVMDGDAEALHAQLVSKFDAGRFDSHTLQESFRTTCDVTGAEIAMEFQDGWKPVLGEFVRGEFRPLTAPAPQQAVDHQVILVPSGELLIADWFRIDAFTKGVKNSDHIDINSAFGLLRQTTAYAQQHGFMSVFVGNTLPRIVQRDGHFIVARVDEDDGRLAGEVKGRVCTDLWWSTGIDREVLVSIVAQSVPLDEARRLVDNEVDDRIASGDVTVLRTPPGQLHLYYTPKPGDLAQFECKDVDTKAVEELYAVVSPSELQWAPKAEKKARRRAGP